MNRAQWGDFPAPVGEAASFEFGPLRLYLKILNEDLWIAQRHRQTTPDQAQKQTPRPAPRQGWTRRALSEEPSQLRFSPLFPDHPIMVHSEEPLVLGPSDEVRLFVRCPLWVQVEAVGQRVYTVAEAPTVVLTRSWYGTPVEGELSYWISSSARRQSSPDPDKPHMALCPIHIVNRSGEDLTVEKILLRVPWLSLYQSPQGFWSDTTRVAYRGEVGPSEVEVTGRAAAEAKRPQRVAPPRQASKRSIASTFASFTRGKIPFWDLFS